MPSPEDQMKFEVGPKDSIEVPTASDGQTPEITKTPNKSKLQLLLEEYNIPDSLLDTMTPRDALSRRGVPDQRIKEALDEPEVETNPDQLQMPDNSAIPEIQTAEIQPEEGTELYRHVIKKPEKPENAYQAEGDVDQRYGIELLIYALDLYDYGQDEQGDLAFLEAFTEQGKPGEAATYLETFQRNYGGKSDYAAQGRRIYKTKLKALLNPPPNPVQE